MSSAVATPSVVIRDFQAAATSCLPAPVRLPATLPIDEVRFPTHLVMGHVQAVGKARVSAEVLEQLADARRNLQQIGMSPTLAVWFDNLLDKADGRYDYHSYIGSRLLAGWAPDAANFTAVAVDQLRLILAILADVALFELDSLTGQETRLPLQMPDRTVLLQRLRHTLSAWDRYAAVLAAIDPASGLPQGLATAIEAPKVLRQRLAAHRTQLDPDLLRRLRLSLLPVSTIHDEYLFIRILQAFETIFGIIVAGMRASIRAVRNGDPQAATETMRLLSRIFDANTGLFRMLSTMQAESFATFRQDTDGASAIQSERYKMIEVLAGAVSAERRSSPAFGQTPVARMALEIGSEPTLAEVLAPWLNPGAGNDADRTDLINALRGFDQRFVQWKTTHVRLAMRFLGDKPGTGATPGTPYLARFAARPLFPFLAQQSA